MLVRGTVWIVGAGPGDPELLTLRARKLIDEADIIFYDALVNDDMLDGVRAECVFVGKRKGYRAFSQDEINAKLLEAAGLHDSVVRLKGGDPFIFGRGGEELLFLRAHGVACWVIPGISAALAAAAGAGIPLTHRGVSSSVALTSGAPAGAIRIPDTDTVAFYMPAGALREIAAAATARGMAGGTQVAVIHNASLPDQRIWYATIDGLARGAVEYPSPLLVIIGDVVGLGAPAANATPAVDNLSAVRSEVRDE